MSHKAIETAAQAASAPDAPSPRVGFVSLGCPKNLVDSEVMMGLLTRAGATLTPDAAQADILVVNTCSFIDKAKQESVDTILEMARHKTGGRATRLVVTGCMVERYRNEIQANIPEVDAVVGTGELESIVAAAGIERANSPFRILSPQESAAAVGTGELESIVAAAGIERANSPFRILSPQESAAAVRAEGLRREQQGRFSREQWDGAIAELPNYLYDEATPRVRTTASSSAYIKIAEGCDHPCGFCIIPQIGSRQVPFAPV